MYNIISRKLGKLLDFIRHLFYTSIYLNFRTPITSSIRFRVFLSITICTRRNKDIYICWKKVSIKTIVDNFKKTRKRNRNITNMSIIYKKLFKSKSITFFSIIIISYIYTTKLKIIIQDKLPALFLFYLSYQHFIIFQIRLDI